MKRALSRIRELTPRNWGGRLTACIDVLNHYFRGWYGYFGVCSPYAKRELQKLDGRARRRLRAIQLKQWKRKRTVARRLSRMRRSNKVWRNVYQGRRGWWSLSRDGVVNYRLTNRWFESKGYQSLTKRHEAKHAMDAPNDTHQLGFQWG